MKVIGVIAEYNPFHNGHQYQLETLRKETNADYIIIAMSGNFLQRGVPALCHKHYRAQMALIGGADLVLELPCIYATASAELFATGGISLLGSTGVVNTLGYGIEHNQPNLLRALVNTLVHEPNAYREKLSSLQKEGLSFPSARAKTLCEIIPSYSEKEINEFLALPNNILALEYEKALVLWNASHTPISSHPIQRIGNHYHDTVATTTYASATAIRNLLFENGGSIEKLTPYLPMESLYLLKNYYTKKELLSENAISSMLYLRLLEYAPYGYEQFADCNRELSKKIQNHLPQYTGFKNFCRILKSKELTYTRISRVLLHILLQIKKEDYAYAFAQSSAPYLRILGFRKDASPLLSEIKKRASAPMISKVADAPKYLPENTYRIFEKDLYAASLYRGITSIQSNQPQKNEFTQEVVIL